MPATFTVTLTLTNGSNTPAIRITVPLYHWGIGNLIRLACEQEGIALSSVAAFTITGTVPASEGE